MPEQGAPHLRCATVALAAIAVVFLSGFAPDDLRVTLMGRYDAMKASMAAHDEPAVAAILAPDFTSIGIDGDIENAAQFIDGVSRIRPDPNRTSKTTLEAMERQGDTVVVQQRTVLIERRYDVQATDVGPDRASHQIEFIGLFTDTWVKPQAVWLLQRSVLNETSYSFDGGAVLVTKRQ